MELVPNPAVHFLHRRVGEVVDPVPDSWILPTSALIIHILPLRSA